MKMTTREIWGKRVNNGNNRKEGRKEMALVELEDKVELLGGLPPWLEELEINGVKEKWRRKKKEMEKEW